VRKADGQPVASELFRKVRRFMDMARHHLRSCVDLRIGFFANPVAGAAFDDLSLRILSSQSAEKPAVPGDRR
jgi:hypothetical protein